MKPKQTQKNSMMKELKRNYELLQSDTCALGALRLICCDAVVGIGVEFQSACCYAEVPEENDFHCFTNIFQEGAKALSTFIEDQKKPNDDISCHLLDKLLIFVENIEDTERSLQEPKGKEFTETEWMCRLTTHFFTKLGHQEDFVLDEHCENKTDTCPCGCLQKMDWGETVIGYERTWYGAVDLMLSSCSLACVQGHFGNTQLENTSSLNYDSSIDQDGSTDMSHDDDSSRQRKISPLLSSRSQLLSQTIVFSFLQKREHPKSHLIPTIGVSKTAIKFFFYDSVNDIFLESPEIPLFNELPGKRGQLNRYTVLATWLVVNYQHFISPVTEDMKSEGKFGFLESAGDNLVFYKDYLDLGQVVPVRFPPIEPWHRPHVLKKLKTSHH